MKTAKVIFLGTVGGLILSFQAGAAQLILPAPTPTQTDLYDDPLDVLYNSTTHVFGVTNWTGYQSLYQNGSLTAAWNDTAWEDESSLTATINSSGDLTSGTFDLWGTINSGDTEILLLSGNLVPGNSGTAWGYDDSGNVNLFSFEFTISGGLSEVISDFGGLGATDGVNLSAEFSSNSGHDTAFTGTWGSSFNNLDSGAAGSGLGYDDIYEVPEPSSLTLVSAAAVLFALTLMYSRKSKAQPAPARAKK